MLSVLHPYGIFININCFSNMLIRIFKSNYCGACLAKAYNRVFVISLAINTTAILTLLRRRHINQLIWRNTLFNTSTSKYRGQYG